MTKREKKLIKKVSKYVERSYSAKCSHCGKIATFLSFSSIGDAAFHVHNQGWQVEEEKKSSGLVCPKCLKGAK